MYPSQSSTVVLQSTGAAVSSLLPFDMTGGLTGGVLVSVDAHAYVKVGTPSVLATNQDTLVSPGDSLFLNTNGMTSISVMSVSGTANAWISPSNDGGASLLTPSLDLKFADKQMLEPGITFTRASSATRYNSSGTLVSMVTDQPRIDYDPITGACKGLLIEEQRTNLLTYSEQLDNAAWTKGDATITANALAAPDGAITADKLVSNVSTAYPRATATVSVTTGNKYTYSVFAKAGEWVFLSLQAGGTLWQSQGSSAGVRFNLSTGTISAGYNGQSTANASIQNVGNGWFRCSVTWDCNATTASGSVSAIMGSADSTAQTTGNGTSGIFIWGAQFELGAFPTSYIPTTTAQVTRAADVATMTGTNFSSWYNQSEGTLFAEAVTTTAITSNNLGMFSVSDGTLNERIQLRRNAGGSTVSFLAVDGGAIQFNDAGTLNFGGTSKMALAYKVNDFIGASSGSLGVADTSGTLPTPTQAEIGFGQGITQLCGHIKRIAYYPRRLSNTELQQLTA